MLTLSPTSLPLSPSLLRLCPLTLNVTSQHCLGMCWTRSSRPSLSADCVWQPKGAPPSTLPLHPAPPSLKHNIITLRNTATGTSSIALFISPQICKISFPFSASPAPHTLALFALCGHSLTLDVALQTHCVHASSSLQCNFHFYFLVFEQPPRCTPTLTELPFLDACRPLLFPASLSALRSVGNSICDGRVM